MVPNLSTEARTYSATSSSRVTSASTASARAAVDRDDAGAALSQQPDGRAADDAGRAGDDGDPAIQTNSIGHTVFPLLVRHSPDSYRCGARPRPSLSGTIPFVELAD